MYLFINGSIFNASLDIWIVDEDHLGAGLINWTGNELFERSLRLLAKSKVRLQARQKFLLICVEFEINRIRRRR